MRHAALDDHTFALRLDPGDDILHALQQFCVESGVNNAGVQGVGSIDSPTLAHYSIKTKDFTDKHLEGIYEVTSLLGNVALIDGQPAAHLHVTLSDHEMHALGGHLVKGKCSATLELIVASYPTNHTKSQDEAIGLKVWDFQD
jgi:predicted DNA-binding protein with PD1-like motif